MCGICGAFALAGPLASSVTAALPAMTSLLAHRGPDGEGFFTDGRVALGHRRLAIIDRAGGDQPICNEDRSIWVVFNGEIYNHHALRRDLIARGHVFRTGSDTETIVHAFEQYGAACLDHLDGMFAFALYDQRRRELFLARDRIGKKPLFYAVLGGVFHFASEIKALTVSPFWNDDIDPEQLEGYLSLGYVLAPHTIYRHVRKLEPGHWLTVRGGLLQTRPYWDLERFGDDARPVERVESELEATLKAAVVDRLESEVPLGAFLSAGIDSGLVVSFMSEAMHGAPVLTTSIGFADAAHNELAGAALTARRFSTRHEAHVIDPDPFVMDQAISAFDEPFAESSAVPTFHLCAAARRHVTVALSGDGGDEVFGGYASRYTSHALEHAARTLFPAAVTRPLGAIGVRWPRASWLPRPLRAGNVLENLPRDPAAAYYADLCFLKPANARALLGRPPSRDPLDSPVFEAVARPYRRCPSTSAVLRAQYADLKVYLPNDVLVKVDRMSMLHGLEVRCPLLDRRVIELAFRVPTATKMRRLEPKHLLRRLARRRLPPELLRLPKHGFTAPVDRWMAGTLAERFQHDVLSGNSAVAGLIDLDRVRTLFLEHRSRHADHAYALWAVWILARWNTVTRGARVSPQPWICDPRHRSWHTGMSGLGV